MMLMFIESAFGFSKVIKLVFELFDGAKLLILSTFVNKLFVIVPKN